ncbi:MAG: tetratricopeptide repeat protein [Thermoanaerobaculia bacterium]
MAIGAWLPTAGATAEAVGSLQLPVEPDRLDRETMDWVHSAVPDNLSQFDRVARILRALQHDKDGPRVRYEEGFTGTAQEAFDTGIVNCLSFSQLVVAMAREVGVEAFYMDVRKFQRFTKDGDLVIVAGHMTAGFDKGPERVILEFSVGPQVNYRDAVKISDETARAYYHSNRGAESLQAGDLVLAAEWLETATRLDPELPDAWVNLGVVLRRQGDIEAAESAYRRAIRLDGEFFPAYQNLAALYRLRGDADSAARMLTLLERRQPTNPFIYLALGDLSLERGDLEDARRFYRRGRRLRRGEPDLLAALGEVALAMGKVEEAERWLAKGQKRGSDNPRVRRLAEAVERISKD